MGIIYKALDVVSRELIGFIPAVTVDFDGAERAALNQDIKFLGAAEVTAGNTTPSTGANPADLSEAATTIKMTKARSAMFALTGEELKGLENSGSRQMLVQGKFEQSLRTLINEMETDLFTAVKAASMGAYGTAGQTPFGTAADMTDLAQVGLILDNMGCPVADRHLVLSNPSMANIRAKQANLFNTGPELQRRGILTELEGFYIHQSGQIKKHTKGTGTGYLVDLTAGYAAGKTAIHVDTGAGTILAGDILTNTKTSRDTAKYVVNTGFAGDGDGDIVLGKPGLQVAWVNNDPLAIGADYTGNFAFHRGAVWFAVRPGEVPAGGDAAADAFIIADPITGLPFEVRVYPQYRRVVYEISAVWGASAIKGEHIATLLG